MGYYVTTESIDITIPKEWLESAYKAVLAMNESDELKRGGSHGPNSERKFWFSWMPEDLSTLADIKEVLLNLGFEVSLNDDGDLVVGHYDSKTGQEDLFFHFIAPFVKEYSYAMWKGEDNAHYKWEFEDGKMRVIPGESEVVWYPENAYSALDSWKQTQQLISKFKLEAKERLAAEENSNA